MELAPMFDNVVLRRDESQEKTEGGILLPDSARDKQERGTVVAVGPTVGYMKSGDRIGKEHLLRKGDRILFAANTGSEVSVDGKKLLIVKETDILAVIRG